MIPQRHQTAQDVRRHICEARFGQARQTTDAFHRLFYERSHHTWGMTYWMRVPLLKNPLDLWIYQEIIAGLRPGLIIETGTAYGGSALFFAHMLDLVDREADARVVSIDLDPAPTLPAHPRVTYLTGDSVSPAVLDVVRHMAAEAAPRPAMVVLDSDHRSFHVAAELHAYAAFVTPGSFLVVEDTNLNDRPVHEETGPGPFEALLSFLEEHPEFAPEPTCEKYLLSYQPGGWLRRAA